jgi:hypothetical protein
MASHLINLHAKVTAGRARSTAEVLSGSSDMAAKRGPRKDSNSARRCAGI